MEQRCGVLRQPLQDVQENYYVARSDSRIVATSSYPRTTVAAFVDGFYGAAEGSTWL